MDDKLFWAMIVAAITLLAFGAMWLGWRGRQKRTSSLTPYEIPALDVSTQQLYTAFYVASTERDRPLERINSAGLGFRGRAELRFSPEGLLLSVAGAEDFFIPRAQITDAVRATWTIDRVVEPGGLLNIQWSWHDQEVDSYLRFPDSDQRDRLQQQLSKTETGVSS